MATFWRRIREMMYGTLSDDGDQEVGTLQGEQDEQTATPVGTEPVRVEEYGDSVSVHYSGALSQVGRPIYVHFGYGPGPWRDVRETVMHQVAKGLYEAEIPVGYGRGALEFCFRNDVGEWDNNDGNNWSHPL